MIKARVDVYSHHVAVTKLTPRGKEAMLAYCRTLGLTGRVKDGIRWVWKIVSVFVGVQANREMFRFNVSQLDQVLTYLMNYGIPKSEMEIVTHDAPKPVQCKIKMLPKWTTTDEQWEYVNYVAADGYIKTVNLQTGRGKILRTKTPIKTPTGWMNIGNVRMGDIITAWDGTPTNVRKIYPQGTKSFYQFKFEDGRTCDAGMEHLWQVYHKGRGWFVTNTQEIIVYLSMGHTLYVPLIKPEDPVNGFNASEAVIAELVNNLITNKHFDGQLFEKLLNGSLLARSVMWKEIKSRYLTTPVHFEDPAVAERVVYLVRSLGGIASAKLNASGNTEIHGSIPTPEDGSIATLRINSVVYCGRDEAVCIEIDHPDKLYVVEDFVVTHNTHIAMRSAELIGERVLLTMKGGYTKKWREDLKDGYGYGPKEIVIPGSTKDLRVLIALGKQGLITQKFIMISNKLLYGFLKHYESTNGDTTFYGCAPHELCEVLGVGFVIRDEVHQEFHFNFRLDLYTHVKKTLNLSATLISDNPIINTMYKWMMPMLTRFGNGTYNKYIDVIAVQYHMLNERVVRCQNLAFKSYSHVLFEQSIMKNAALTKQYFDFIYDIYAEHYLKDRQPGMKSLVFFATVDMCTCFADYMSRRVDNLVVKRYTQEDDYSNILTAELVVTTLKSAGTAVDIPGLYVAIMTDSINSRQQNEQAVGRLRVMRGPLAHLNPKFIYLYCRTIPKQLEYHLNKREVLRDKVKSLIEVNWDFVLGYFR